MNLNFLVSIVILIILLLDSKISKVAALSDFFSDQTVSNDENSIKSNKLLYQSQRKKSESLEHQRDLSVTSEWLRLSLPSWDASSQTIKRITQVLENVSSRIPNEQRIATFDCDGTLFTEKPTYIETFLSYYALCADGVGNRGKYYSIICSTDIRNISSLTGDQINELLLFTFANWTKEHFDDYTKNFVMNINGCILKDEKRPCISMIYQPMKELIQFLITDFNFQIYVVTGSQQYVVRVLIESAFEFNRDILSKIHIIGTTVKNIITFDPNLNIIPLDTYSSIAHTHIHPRYLSTTSKLIEESISSKNILPYQSKDKNSIEAIQNDNTYQIYKELSLSKHTNEKFVEIKRSDEFDIIVFNQIKIQEIYRFTPYIPIFSFGNDANDMQTFYYAMSHPLGKSFSLCSLVHHNDEIREYYYDKLTNSTLGKEAERWDWNIIRMKEEWNNIF